MQDLNDLALFAAVVEHGSFTAAAAALGVAKSHVSQRISRLETRLGVRLVQRTTRKHHVTEIGNRYYRHCRQMLLEAERAQRLVESAHGEPSGELRVACPSLFSQLILGPMAADFLGMHPQVRLQIDVLNRAVDVIEEGYDVAFRVRQEIEDSSLVVRSFGIGQQVLVASPALLDTRAAPRRPADLPAWPSLGTAMAAERGRHRWHLRSRRGDEAVVEHHPRFVTDDMQALVAAAIAGIGVAMLPGFLCAEPLAREVLRIVLPSWRPFAGNIHAVYASRHGLSSALRSFLDFVAPRIEVKLAELG